jgi:hypothetical protein
MSSESIKLGVFGPGEKHKERKEESAGSSKTHKKNDGRKKQMKEAVCTTKPIIHHIQHPAPNRYSRSYG